MSNHEISFHLPTKPYSVIDAINRMALATGSTRAAERGSGADYNGHAYKVHTTIHGYAASYTWAGLRWIARNCDARDALRAGVSAYKTGGLGASLSVSLKPEDAGLAAEFGLLPGEDDKTKADWWTWKHAMAAEVLGDEKRWGVPGVKLLLEAESKAAYLASVDTFLRERRAARTTTAKAG